MVLAVARFGPDELAQVMAFDQPIVSGEKVATMEMINDVVNFADSMFERLPQQNYAMVLFVLGCGLGLVGVVRSRKRSALLQKQLDKLSRDVSQLELAENRRLIELLNSSSRPRSQQDATSIVPGEEIDGSGGMTGC
jgi:hypothetical protein